MQQAAAGYSVMIEFVEVEPGKPHGSWTADVAVSVKAGKQEVANIAVPGPLLLLRLPPGRYAVDAIHADVKLSKVLEIKPGAKVLRERFIWRAAPGALGSDLKT